MTQNICHQPILHHIIVCKNQKCHVFSIVPSCRRCVFHMYHADNIRPNKTGITDASAPKAPPVSQSGPLTVDFIGLGFTSKPVPVILGIGEELDFSFSLFHCIF